MAWCQGFFLGGGGGAFTPPINLYCPLASFPGLPHLQLLIASSMQKRRGKAWGIFSRDTRHNRHKSSRFISTVKDMYETDLAFCASYEDGTSANWELHRAYEAYPGYKAWLQRAAEWQTWKCPAMTQSSRGAKRRHYLEFHPLYHSYPSAVLLRTWICFTGRTYLFSETCFSFLASL